ncbi:jg22952 [Pararge aegeria aegeria]|uniref:Jg22952 protein n=1 Tax=Pararge aegeria aegeria TaxID=348720 RepID=A0A8S4QU70_9NEOP|nr:jg22952 [Pararge aegeria aegeria]
MFHNTGPRTDPCGTPLSTFRRARCPRYPPILLVRLQQLPEIWRHFMVPERLKKSLIGEAVEGILDVQGDGGNAGNCLIRQGLQRLQQS